MESSAKSGALLYISDDRASDVAVFTYPGRAKAGKLTGFDLPGGECVDATGNIWITNTGMSQVLEYAHGGTAPIATLDDPGYYPVGCSVNLKTGDLAVANIEQTAHGLPGTIAVYKKARGNPGYYDTEDQGFYAIYSVGYDDKGNLFFDGTNAEVGADGKFLYGEVPKRSSKVEPLTLSGAAISFPGAVEWDGHHITVGDQDNAVIYQTSGSRVIGSTPLTGSSDVVQYTVAGNQVVGPDAGNATVEFYKYPAGGSPTAVLTGFTTPVGSAISKY